MISKPVPELPKDPEQQRRFIQRILNEMYQDIKTLFETTTDYDLFEKKQRENR
jgi:hypothetical protein